MFSLTKLKLTFSFPCLKQKKLKRKAFLLKPGEICRTENFRKSVLRFFTFGLSISGDKSEAWLELTGVDGAKDFIKSEIGLVDN
jgi:hypothetical protein